MKTLEEIKLSDIMPDSINKDVTVTAAADAIDPQLKGISADVDKPGIYSRIDELSSEALDNLAAQYDVAAWRDHWDIAMKRSVIKTAIASKRKVGTVSAVKMALESIGSYSKIVEWWQTKPKGTPHTFTIYVTLSDVQGTVSDEMQNDIQLMIDAAKPLRSHYEMVLTQTLGSEIGIYAEMRSAVYNRVG